MFSKMLRFVGDFPYQLKIQPMVTMLQRICWNSRGWRMPTGNSSDGGYPSDEGFGHEEWNFQIEDAFEDNVYGYLYFSPGQRTLNDSEGLFNIGFWTLHPETRQRLLVGFYHQASYIQERDIFQRLYQYFNANGILERRVDELINAVPQITKEEAIDNLHRTFLTGAYKYRCAVENIEILEQFQPLPDAIDGKTIGSYFATPTLITSFPAIETRSNQVNRPSAGRQSPLAEDAYYRENARNLRVIIPRHNRLSNIFCKWLQSIGAINISQERNRVDVSFETNSFTYLAELKVCYGVGATKSIREALGQLLEYNYYPNRNPSEKWLIVLDERPSQNDFDFISRLNSQLNLPVNLGWRVNDDFHFNVPNVIQ